MIWVRSNYLFIFLCLFLRANSHSWLACSDYAEKNAATWNANLCRGFPRDSAKYASKNNFGTDTGELFSYDTRPGENGNPCRTVLSGSSYSAEYPKAIYYPGQQVVLAHPMKNHGADICTSIYIPDRGNFIYRGKRGKDTNRKLSLYKKYLVADLGLSPTGQRNTNPSLYPKPGYQNAPLFCSNTDTSLGTYSFNVPRTLKSGQYTFVWVWLFNSKSDVYSTCFDVEIVANKRLRDEKLKKRGISRLEVACGGMTSDMSRGSRLGCQRKTGEMPDKEAGYRPTLRAHMTCASCTNNVSAASLLLVAAIILLHHGL